MTTSQEIRQCFIIGPMKDMSRLERLRDQIVGPILKEYGYRVTTPEQGEIGNVMRAVLLGLEQADILIADITGSNPNVLYELGVYHAFGKPCIIVKEEVRGAGAVATPFDIQEYRYQVIDLKDLAGTRKKMKALLTKVVENLDTTDFFSNPVTDFYHAPIAEIPTAIGLFKNYKKNFIDMLIPRIFDKDLETGEYTAKIQEEVVENGVARNRTWTKEERAALKMQILVPAELYMSTYSYISGKKNEGILPFKTASMATKGRPFTFNFITNEKGERTIVDIPTILSTLNESICQRRKDHRQYFGEAEWTLLEKQELERFAGKCTAYLNVLAKEHPEGVDKVEVVWRWKP
jgi:hypothetical protein